MINKIKTIAATEQLLCETGEPLFSDMLVALESTPAADCCERLEAGLPSGSNVAEVASVSVGCGISFVYPALELNSNVFSPSTDPSTVLSDAFEEP